MKFVFETCKSVLQVFESLPTEEIQHMRRVGLLVGLFTQQLANAKFFDSHSEAYKLFGEAATYHDIGKAWVPKEILIKPGRLTDQERQIMCEHPKFSIHLFNRVEDNYLTGISGQTLLLARDCALYHHEWWNGDGYPYKKAYNQIPLIARIAAICDSYDAMTSNRVYRVAHSHDFACRELKRCAGTQFQPGLILQFLLSRISLADVTHLKTVGF
ncbi:MAG TPA: HD domain-containing phosphohydrolase [Clostridia bacterium]|nr:HD domain-containing phosphohydrolase [Clostridia bacterium]